MKTVKEMLRTDEIRQILIDEFYDDKFDFMTLYNKEITQKELTIDDRLNNMYNELSNIIDARIKAIETLSGEEFYSLLDQKEAILRAFSRNFYKNILAKIHNFEELAEEIVDDIIN